MSPLDAAGRAEVEHIFEQDTPPRLAELAHALDDLAGGDESARAGAQLEAHSLRGAAAIVGHDWLTRLCSSIEDLLAEDDLDPRELRAAARLVRDAGAGLEVPDLPSRRLRERVVPQRFMSQLAAILVLTLVPAFGISIYDAYHGRLFELLLIVALGLLGLALGLGGAQRALARPLAAIASTANRLGSGDLSARTGVDPRRGELAQLAGSIDAMAVALEERTAERERAVASLARLADELEERVRDRTTALESAREEANRESRAKTAFLSRLSHELRTPLNAIRGFSQLLGTGELPPDHAEAAAHISSGAEHMTRLVEELLDTARIEAGEFRVDPEPVVLGEVVWEVVELSRGLAADHDVSLTASEIDPGLGVLADRGRLRQSLLNLVTNAIVYNRRGGAVSVRGSRRPDGRPVVDVIDTGEGITATDIERLFVPYDRLGRGPESSGLGLGLALSKRLVEAMGGTIEVESEVGVGTRFTIDLPEAESSHAAADAGASTPPAVGSVTRRVLYIDDNATSRKLVELLLRGRSVDFEGASTAADGIAAARAREPDLILLDLQLPDGSGEEVLRALRSEASLRAVPIVMLSAQASRDTVRRLLEAGANDYLTKPLEVDRAADVIERFLRRDQS